MTVLIDVATLPSSSPLMRSIGSVSATGVAVRSPCASAEIAARRLAMSFRRSDSMRLSTSAAERRRPRATR